MIDFDAIVKDLRTRAVDRKVTLDDVVAAIGDRPVSYDDVAKLFARAEKGGLKIAAPKGGRSEKLLAQVLTAARELRGTLTRVPSYAEIATHATLTVAEVEMAMALVKVMQR